MGMESLEIARDSDAARRGGSALELVQRLAKTIASTEAHLEQQLQKALADVTAAKKIYAKIQKPTSMSASLRKRPNCCVATK